MVHVWRATLESSGGSALVESVPKNSSSAIRNHLVQIHGRNHTRIHLLVLVDRPLLFHVLHILRGQKLVQGASVEEHVLGASDVDAAVVVAADAVEPRRGLCSSPGYECVAVGVDLAAHARAESVVAPVGVEVVENVTFPPSSK